MNGWIEGGREEGTDGRTDGRVDGCMALSPDSDSHFELTSITYDGVKTGQSSLKRHPSYTVMLSVIQEKFNTFNVGLTRTKSVYCRLLVP